MARFRESSRNGNGTISEGSVINQGRLTTSRAGARSDPFPFTAVVHLCNHLATRVRENDPNANVAPDSSRWQTDMRLLLIDRCGDVRRRRARHRLVPSRPVLALEHPVARKAPQEVHAAATQGNSGLSFIACCSSCCIGDGGPVHGRVRRGREGAMSVLHEAVGSTIGICRGEGCDGRMVVVAADSRLYELECETCGWTAALPTREVNPQVRCSALLEQAGIPARYCGREFDRDAENKKALTLVRLWLADVAKGDMLPHPPYSGCRVAGNRT